jgi:hypothetical protein
MHVDTIRVELHAQSEPLQFWPYHDFPSFLHSIFWTIAYLPVVDDPFRLNGAIAIDLM